MIRNSNRNISVAKGHQYTVEKVKFAMDFVSKAGRNTTLQDWVDAYNYIKNANETTDGCHSCKGAKFTAAVRNYAQYGYLTLLNEGHSPEEFVHHPEPAEVFDKKEMSSNTEQEQESEQPVIEIVTKDDETLANALESLHKVQEAVNEKPKKNKGGRPKKVKK